jgi:hypothetical protein
MWVCSNHPFGVHQIHVGGDVFTVTVPLDGYAACDCDGFAESKRAMKSHAEEVQITCLHIAQTFGGRCGYRSEHGGNCRMCGKPLLRIEDVIPGWVGKDRKSLLDDLLEMRKDLDDDETTW